MKRAVAALAAVLLLAGCTSATPDDAQPRALTTEEAQLLAVARFQNYDAGTRAVHISIAGSDALTLDGWIDFADHVGYGAATDSKSGAQLGLLAWNLSTIAVYEHPIPDPLVPVPTDGWVSGVLDPVSSTVHNILLLGVNLGSDRPDNPQLLQQTDARWLRADAIDGVPVMVIAGPSADEVATADPAPDSETIRYWIDETGRLLRFEVRQSASSSAWSVIDLGETAAVEFGAIPGIEIGG